MASRFDQGRKPMENICVYCGSMQGRRPEYAAAARRVGTLLAERGIGIVYGGGSIGLMGILADAALAAGGHVTGIIPEHLSRREIAHADLTELVIVRSMHERKALMEQRSDAFIALPGGLGTLEELFEILTWAQLGLHRKPCGLLNVDGYYDPLISLLDRAVAEGFLRDKHRGLLVVDDDPERLLDRFEDFTAPEITKWIGRDET
jgi:uncharacterized protein (TIGR00730 family)